MKKNHKSTYKPLKPDRYAVLSVNFNIRYDGQYDDGGGKLLLAILPHMVPAVPKARRAEKPEKNG